MNSVASRNRSGRAANLAALLGTASFVALGSSAAQAQVAEVLITGSLIAGTQAVGVPVTAVGEEQFLEQGAVTVADMLFSVPSISVDPTLTSLRGGGTTGYGQNVAIHGFEGSGGDAITLMLINGRRWPIQGHGGDTVDPSIIPQLAVDRVDILTAGASAVYGADAIVGVINVVLKRNFEGAISQVNYSQPVHIGQGMRIAASHLHGISWDTGNITLTAEAYFQQRIRASAIGRDKYTTNFEDLIGYDATPLALQMPGVVSTGAPHAPTQFTDLGFTALLGTRFCDNCYSLPQGLGWAYGDQAPGPTTTWAQIQANKWVVGQRNEENQRINYDDSWALPQQTREAFVGTLNQVLTDDFFGLGEVELHGTMFYSNRKGQMHFGINTNSGNSREHASFRDAGGTTIPTINPYYPSGAPSGLRIHVNASPLLGSPSRISFENIATRYEFGFNFNSLPFGWVGDAFYSMSNEQNNTNSTNMINRDRARLALGRTVTGLSGNTLTKPADVPYLNPFCDALTFGTSCNSPLTLDYIRGFRLQQNQWRIRQMGINFSGPIFEIPSGEIQAGLSAEHTSQHFFFRDMSDAGTQPADSPAAVDLDIAKRIAHAFFGQVNIPVLGGEWSIPGFIEGLDVELGYRVDKYDFTDSYIKTPKVAGTLTLGGGITARGAWGKSFRAPGFSQASAAAGSRAIATNINGGVTVDDFVFRCTNIGTGASGGTALAGSATALINPTCSQSNSQLYAPAGIQLAGGSGLGDYMRGLSQSLRPGGPAKGIGPETAKQYVFGVNIAPTDGIFSGLNLDVSYFNIKISDTIRSDSSGSESGIDIGDNPLARHLFAIRPSFVTPGADDTEFNQIIDGLAALSGTTSTFDRDRTYNFVFDGANTNVGFIHLKGIDFSFRYDWDMGNLGSWHIGTAGYYEIDQLENANSDSPVTSIYEGQNSGAQLKRLRSRAGWTNGTWSATLFNTWRGHEGPNNNISLPDCFWKEGFSAGDCYAGSPFFPQPAGAGQFYNTSPGWMQWDLNVTYNTGLMPTNEYLQNLNLSLTVNNIIDDEPPFSFNARSGAREIRAFDTRFSELGRFVSVTITKNW